jgi:hypothetical protein
MRKDTLLKMTKEDLKFGIYDFIFEENTESVLGYFVEDENLTV